MAEIPPSPIYSARASQHRPVRSPANGKFRPESGFRHSPDRAPTNRGTEANTMIITFLVAASYFSTAILAGLFTSAASLLTFFLGFLP